MYVCAAAADVAIDNARDAKASPGPVGCAKMMVAVAPQLNGRCCGKDDKMCSEGVPRFCSGACSSVWMPFATVCSEWIKQTQPKLVAVTLQCEREEYGRYLPGKKGRGRCNDADLARFAKQLAPACCRGASCSPAQGLLSASGKLTIPAPCLYPPPPVRARAATSANPEVTENAETSLLCG
jgi:hypothetical protein